ncbi:hypothetical protein DW094_11815 [Ruminococcaceae bacterium AM07-15]|nr:hypothetical protein DW094_11815 [Ruminococcaceae bacterium AM07-15]
MGESVGAQTLLLRLLLLFLLLFLLLLLFLFLFLLLYWHTLPRTLYGCVQRPPFAAGNRAFPSDAEDRPEGKTAGFGAGPGKWCRLFSAHSHCPAGLSGENR